MHTLLNDIRYGVRMLWKVPGFTAVAVITLALGIGANTTIFSWINSTLLNPIPGLTHTSQIVALTAGGTADNPIPFSYPDYADLRQGSRSFAGLTASSIYALGLTGKGKPERTWGTLVSTNYFDTLGVRPILGRGFLPGEEDQLGGAPVVVISYRLWQTHFGGSRSVIGSTININLHPYIVVGVAPAVFQGSQTGLRSELWIPISMEQQVVPSFKSDLLHQRGEGWLVVQGRLKIGIARAQAEQEMNLLMRRIAEQYPDSHRGPNLVTLYPLWRAPYGANGYIYVLLPMLLAIAGVVLLLACANVANLLLVRSVARQREIAIRLSIGCGRWQLVRQFMIENLMLALAAGGVALLITMWTAGTFSKFIPPTGVPISLQVQVDHTVLLATLAVALLTALIFGVVPALRASSVAPGAVLKEETLSASGTLHRARLSRGLVVTQISLSLLLLVCAGLFIRGFRNSQRSDPGFQPNHVLLGSYNLFAAGYSKDDGIAFDRLLLTRLQVLPGVQSVSLAQWVPLGFTLSEASIKPDGYVPRPHESMVIGDAMVGPGYLRTMQIPLLAGREFTLSDSDKSQPVVIVNRELAERYWPHQDPLGKQIGVDDKLLTVVGVAQNSKYNDLRETPHPFVYVPILQEYYPGTILHVRVAGDPLALAATVEKTVHGLNPDLPVFDLSTLESRVQLANSGERIAATFVGAFGLLALLLAAVGIYGVIAYTTRQRTHEIGIRMALGAQRGDVFRMVLNQGFRLTLVGLIVGLGVSYALTRFLRSLLFGVTATDTLTFAGVVVLLSAVSLAACYLPAQRATKIDPMLALRYE